MININSYLKYFNHDKIDISRAFYNDDTGKEELKQLYTDIKCDIQLKEIDNPDTNALSTTPIITVLKIYCNNDVDIQNNDYVTAYKIDDKGNTIATYKGNSGQPYKDLSRTQFIITIKKGI